MPTKDKRIGLEDVARESGFSISTVSLALRDRPGLPQETRQRVLDTARSLGYRSRGTSFRRKGSLPLQVKNVGVVIKAQPDDFPQTNQFYSHVLVGIEAACRQYKINLIMATILVDDFNHPIEVPSILQEGGVDGILVVGAYLELPMMDILRQRSLPMVLVDAYVQEGEYDSIVSDNGEGTCKAVGYLLRRGHRSFGFVGGCSSAYPSLRERREGFLRGLDLNLEGRGTLPIAPSILPMLRMQSTSCLGNTQRSLPWWGLTMRLRSLPCAQLNRWDIIFLMISQSLVSMIFSLAVMCGHL